MSCHLPGSLRRGLGCLIAMVLAGTAACNGPGDPMPEPSPAAADLSFVDVTREAGLEAFRHVTGAFGKEWFPETVGGGGGFIDYDGDGWMDLVLVGGGVWPGRDEDPVPALSLYRNLGDGSFRDVTGATGLEAVHAYGFGVTAADYDNDGDTDLFLTTLYENLLFRNDGGVFTEVGAEAGLADHAAWSTAALFFDADRDGWLDLYVGNYVVWSPEKDIWCTMDGETKAYCTPQAYEGVPGRFYHNNGDGTFREMTRAAGFGNAPGKTLGVTEVDFNRDGWSDLIVANDTQRDLLYVNQGDGTFVEQGVLSGIAFDENGKARAGMGIDAGDVDNDGRPTVFIGHFSNQMVGVYRYLGNDLFIDRAALSRIGHPSLLTLTFGLFLFDADRDGYLDLLLANGHIAEDIERVQDGIGYRQRAQLFLNRGDGTFVEVTDRAGPAFEQRLVARGAAYGDYDRDGDLDILLTENGGRAYLWRNDSPPASWLRVYLQGTASNRDAIGARIVAVAGPLRMERRIRTGSSYLSHSELVATFGLGQAARIDSLIVEWPSGRREVFSGVSVDQEVRLLEGTGRLEPLARQPAPDPA
ncbi:RNA-binding protein [Rhodothermaceae bacterium RA]|nr:RNA-binding protein [Rhodothermaceae bacterium RA]